MARRQILLSLMGLLFISAVVIFYSMSHLPDTYLSLGDGERNNSFVDVGSVNDSFVEHIFDDDIEENIDLSIIIASRNDNFGSNPILRLRFTLQNLLLFSWKSLYNVSIEVIVIEWNPVLTNPHVWQYQDITQLLIWNKQKYNNKIYFYSIPSFYNDRIDCNNNNHCPFYEYHAKNVGLRRSKGKWKLIINIDDLFGINLLNLLGKSVSFNLLDPNGLYQGRRGHINIKHIYKNYINKSEMIQVEEMLNVKKPSNCFYQLH